MKKLTFIAFLLFLFSHVAFGQNLVQEVGFSPCFMYAESGEIAFCVENVSRVFRFYENRARVDKGRKIGYIDKTGKIIIPTIYDDGSPNFNGGVCAVSKNGKWGFIDSLGNEVIPFIYDNAISFSEGLASVAKNGKWGVIDQNNKIIIDFKYDGIYQFVEGIAIVWQNSKYGYIDKTGKSIIKIKYDNAGKFSEGLANVIQNGKSGFIDKEGKIIISLVYDAQEPKLFKNGIVWMKKNNKGGFLDKKGNVVIPFIHTYSPRYYDSLIIMSVENQEGRYHMFYDYQGNQHKLSDYKFYLKFLGKDFIVVTKNNKWGVIDWDGNPIIPIEYDESPPKYHDKSARVFKKNNQMYYFDNKGNEYEGYESLTGCFSCSYETKHCVGLQKNGLWGVINDKGKTIIPFKYEALTDITYWGEDVVGAKMNGKWGLINHENKIILPFEYEGFGYYSEGLIAVRKNGKWGFVDTNGNVIISPMYDDADVYDYGYGEFVYGYAFVRENHKPKFINKNNKTVFKLDDYEDFHNVFECGKFLITKKEKWGLIDKNKNIIIRHVFDEITISRESRYFTIDCEYYFNVKQDGKWGIYDHIGREIIKPKYDMVSYTSLHDVFIVKKEDKFAIFDKEGNKVTNFIFDKISTTKSFKLDCCWFHMNKKGEFYVETKQQRQILKKYGLKQANP